MENVATLKAEMVNEIEFVTGERWNSRKYIKTTHTDLFEAKVNVKVGNAVEEITLAENSEYRQSYTRKSKSEKEIARFGIDRYVGGHKRTWVGLKANTTPFKTLKEVGIKVDYDEVISQYTAMLKAMKHRDLVLKRSKNIAIYRKRREDYPTRWFTKFEETIRADKNKTIQGALPDVIFTLPTLNEYKTENKSEGKIAYRGVTAKIQRDEGSFVFEGGWFGPNSNGATEYANISDHKRRKAKKEGTIFFKIIEAIDYLVDQKNRFKTEREKLIIETEATRLRLEKLSGYPVYMKEERAYSKERRNGGSWLEQKFYLITEQPTSYYGSFKGIRVNIGTTGYEETKRTVYSVNGITNLRQDQFQKIVEVLIDGREIFPTVITPEKTN